MEQRQPEPNQEPKSENGLVAFIKKMWAKEAIRFLFVGGLNTLIGILFTMLLRYLFEVGGGNPEVLVIYYSSAQHSIYFSSIAKDTLDTQILYIDVPYLINFVALLPLAYTMHAKIAFRTRWTWKKLAVYPLSSIPNFLLTSIFICLFAGVLGLNPNLSYFLAPVLALPIMFFVIRFLVKPIRKRRQKEPKNEDPS